ncbi:MAG: hypothetical protein ABII94_04825 [Patescibacteria group bacterium]
MLVKPGTPIARCAQCGRVHLAHMVADKEWVHETKILELIKIPKNLPKVASCGSPDCSPKGGGVL